MANPVLKLIDPIRGSGAWGTDPFGSGTTTFGGSDADPFELSVIQLGSDDLTEDLNRDRAGVTLSRYGIPVAARTWKQARVWRVQINVAVESYIRSLREFFEAKAFYLYPDGDDSDTYYTTYWLEDEFRPRQTNRPGYYSISFTLKETNLGTSVPVYIPDLPTNNINGDVFINGTLDANVILSGGTDLAEIFADQVELDAVSDRVGSLEQIDRYMDEPSGFVDRTSSAMSAGTGTFSIWATGSSFTIYTDGTGHTISDVQTVSFDTTTSGPIFVYFDTTGTLVTASTFSLEIIESNAYASSLYWNAEDQEVVHIGDERHGITMDNATHKYLHEVEGTRYQSGLAVDVGNVDGAGSDAADASFSVSLGVIRDEDIRLEINSKASGSTFPILYKSGATADWHRRFTQYVTLTGATGLGTYNQQVGGVWQLTELNNAKFSLLHVIATDAYDDGSSSDGGTLGQIIGIAGENEYGTVSEARAAAADEITTITTEGLPFQEWLPIGTIIFQSSNSYSNNAHSRIRSTDDGAEYIDFRQATLTPGGAPSSHSALSNLGNDDHLQYYNEARLTGSTHDVLTAQTLVSNSSIYVNSDGPDGNGVIYFYANGSRTSEYIAWSEVTEQFEVSTSLQLDGDLTVGSINAAGDITANLGSVAGAVVSGNTFYSGGVDLADIIASGGGGVDLPIPASGISAGNFSGNASALFAFPGDVAVAGWDLYIGSGSASSSANGNIYFKDAGFDDARYIRWNTSVNRFEFSNQIYVLGDIRANGGDVYADQFFSGGTDLATIIAAGAGYGPGDDATFGALTSTTLLVSGSGGIISSGSVTAEDNVVAKNFVQSLGSVFANGNVYINQGGPDADSYLYFYDGSSPTGRYFRWDNTDGRFEVNAPLSASTILGDTVKASSYAGFEHDSNTNIVISGTAGGWYRLGTIADRGGVRVIISTTGGNYVPTTFIIDAYKNWTDVATLRLEKYGNTNHINDVRIINEGGVYYLDINVTADPDALQARVYVQKMLGYDSTWTIYTDTLEEIASTTGTTAALASFVPSQGGVTVENFRTEEAAVIGATLTVSGDVNIIDDSIRLNYTGPDADSFIYFYEGGNAFGRSLKWDNADNRFEFNDELYVNGNITSNGVVYALASLRSDASIYLNYAGPDDNSYVYFYDAGSPTGRWLRWYDAGTRFWLNGPLQINDGVSASTGGIHILDDRDAEQPPSAFDRLVAWEFKRRAVVNVGGTGTYGALETIAPWSDDSGGPRYQQFHNEGGFFWRTGFETGDVWNDWEQIVFTGTDVQFGALTGSNLYSNANIFLDADGGDGDSFIFFYEGGSQTGRHLKWDDANNRFQFNDTLVVEGAVAAYSQLYVNYDGPDGDAYIYFYEGSDPTGRYLRWDDSEARFDFNDDLYVAGTLSAQTSISAGTDMYIAGDPVARSIDIQEFTSSGTWTKPAGAKYVEVYLWGGGGGGGGGAGGSTNDSGGGGGAGGAFTKLEYRADELSSTEVVTVGSGGTGGAGASLGGGSTGEQGGYSSFKQRRALGGYGGTGGAKAAGVGGDSPIPVSIFAAGANIAIPGTGATGGNGTIGENGIRHFAAGGGGGGGGGHDNTSTGFAGGEGGADINMSSALTGSALGGGVLSAQTLTMAGDGGDGGDGSYGSAGQDGSGGGFPAGGGGGGGASYASTGGAGGSGGGGRVIVKTYF